MIKRIILLALLAGNTFLLSAQRNKEEVLIQSQALASADIRSVDAETEGGNILLEGVSGSEARVEVYAWADLNEEETKKLFSERYDVKINATGGKLTVIATRKNKRQRDQQINVSLRVFVPASVSSDLKTSGGNIHCKGLSEGKQQVMTSGGNVAFEQVKGNVTGKTSGGNISVNDCGGTLDLSTSGGNIHAMQSRASLSLFTSGGNISLDDLSGTIKAQTSGGNVAAERVAGVLTTSSSGGNLSLKELSCAVDATTNGGNMDVTILKADQYVKLRNSGSGTTQLELPEGIGVDIDATGRSVNIGQVQGFKGDVSEGEVKGTIKGGGIPVTIDGGGSRVVVTMK